MEEYEINYLTPANCRFFENEGKLVGMEYNGKTYPTVYVYRSFPNISRDEFICVKNETAEQEEEIGIIKSLSEFDKSTYDLISKQLDNRYFTPEIIGIKSIKDKYGYTNFEVKTTSGDTSFAVRDMFRSVHKTALGFIIITDVDGNRYKVDSLLKRGGKNVSYLKNFI